MELITIQLTPGELGILLRNFKYDAKSAKNLIEILRVAARFTGMKNIDTIYEKKEQICMDTVQKIKRLAKEAGDQRKIDTYDSLFDQYMHSASLDRETRERVEAMFLDFISNPENLRLALIDPMEAEAHVQFMNMFKEIKK